MTRRPAAAFVSPPDPATLDAMLTRLKLTAIRDQLDTLLAEAEHRDLTLVETVGVGVYLPRLKVLAREIRRTPGHALAVDLDEAIAQVRVSDLICRGFPERLGLPS